MGILRFDDDDSNTLDLTEIPGVSVDDNCGE